MKIDVTILDRHTAAHAVRGPHPFTHLISIGDAEKAYPLDGYENVPQHLCLFFDDITRWRPGYTMPDEEHVRRILRFAKDMKGERSVSLLAHCEQGIARSTAAVYIVLAYLYGPGQEAKAMADVVHARSSARPNELMVELADRVLKREGRLVRELELARLARLHRPYGDGY